jgi:hypothetical protein
MTLSKMPPSLAGSSSTSGTDRFRLAEVGQERQHSSILVFALKRSAKTASETNLPRSQCWRRVPTVNESLAMALYRYMVRATDRAFFGRENAKARLINIENSLMKPCELSRRPAVGCIAWLGREHRINAGQEFSRQ